MATKQEIFDYVMNTPQNTNAAVLGSLLDNLEGGGTIFEYAVEFTLNGQEEITSAKYYHNNEELTFLEFLENSDQMVEVKFGEEEEKTLGILVDGDPDEKYIIINLPLLQQGGMFIYLEEDTYISDFSNNFSIQLEDTSLIPNYSFDQFNHMRLCAPMNIEFNEADLGTGIIKYSSSIGGSEVIEIFANPDFNLETIDYFIWTSTQLQHDNLDLTPPK